MKVGRVLRSFTPLRMEMFRKIAGRKRHAAGFTIIETMIVLSVTAVMFLIAVVAVGGKQNETEFQQAINSMPSILQQTITQVESGDYESGAKITCDAVSGGTGFGGQGLQLTNTASSEGSSNKCIYLGKVIQFGVKSTNPQEYITYPVVGLRDNGDTLAGAAPLVVAPDGASHSGPTFPDASTVGYLPGGLTVHTVKYKVGANRTAQGAVGFMSGLGDYGFTAGNPTQQLFYLLPIRNTQLNETKTTMAGQIDNSLVGSFDWIAGPTAPAAYSVQICFASGTTNQSGLITIGGNGGNGNLASITTTIYSDKVCK